MDALLVPSVFQCAVTSDEGSEVRAAGVVAPTSPHTTHHTRQLWLELGEDEHERTSWNTALTTKITR